jgi:hypothetical protein
MEDLVSAYADGELDEADTALVEAHLDASPAARQALAMHREATALLRSAFAESRFKGPSALPPAVPVRRRRLPGAAWAVAASLLLGVLGYGAGATWPDLLQSDRDRMLSEVAEYHAVYSRETVHLVEVPAAQVDHLKAWLGNRVKAKLVVPDFREAGLTFAGGRLVVLDGAPVAELMYTRDKGLPIGFCVLYRTGSASGVTVARRGATSLATWDDGGHSYIVVGEAAAETVQGLAALARKQI